MKTGFLIAAPSSASGKTTVARGLMALLSRQGLRVQPFKCGPDFIDTKFHESVCQRASINLDTFMASPEHVRELFEHYTADADVAIVEGMMGLFDGYDRDRGSCAEIAHVLNLPVVLVVDARSAAYSMAALLQGFIHFRTDLRFAGVIFNKVGSQRHAAMLCDVAAEVGLRCLGCIPKQTALEQGSRYLGLDFSELSGGISAADVMEQYVDLAALLATHAGESANTLGRIDQYTRANWPTHAGESADTRGRVLVALNEESFSFVYAETLDLLRRYTEVQFFDPEKSSTDDVKSSLADCRLLYLPGGYPEKHLDALEKASGIRQAIRDYALRGGRIIAECGGMMYLCREVHTDDGLFPMCGVLPYSITARTTDRRLSLGYRQFKLNGISFRGHEFHYTRFADPQPPSITQVYNAKGDAVPTPVMREGNVIASYTHLSPQSLLTLFSELL